MMTTTEITTLTDEALVALLLAEEDRLPRAAAEEVVRRGVTFAPRLIRILDDETVWADPGSRWWAAVHAFYLLARMQPPGALDVLLRALEAAERHQIDWITNDAPSILAAFGPSALPRLREAALDERLEAWTRMQILIAAASIGCSHAECRDDTLTLLRTLGRDRTTDVDLQAPIGYALLSFALPEDRELIEFLAGDFVYNEHDVEDVYGGKADPPGPGKIDWMSFYDDGAISRRQARWKEEKEAAERREEAPHPGASAADEPFEAPPPLPPDEPPPPLRAGPKIGRNDPCPCVSGKKFKKCCGR